MTSSVFIYQTALREHSTAWRSEAHFPEGAALDNLVKLAQSAEGGNPFTDTIKPGDRVVVKPNLVRNWHPEHLDLYSIITHPAVIRAVVDQVYRALRGEGSITIADAAMGDTDFDDLVRVTELDKISEYYWQTHQFRVDILDLRKYRYHYQQDNYNYGHEVQTHLPGSPLGYVSVDMGAESAFTTLSGRNLLEGTDVARRQETINSKGEEHNYYLVAREILNANVLVHVPKLKVHSKVGVTLNCKGMVGINGDKNLLPHFRWGGDVQGGDQFPPNTEAHTPTNQLRMRLGRLVGDTLLARSGAWWSKGALWAVQTASAITSRTLKFQEFDSVNGNWHGNDTAWRLAADLIRTALFADHEGVLQATPQRRFLSIVDGIIAGEGNGPLHPMPKAVGVLAMGTHPIAVDLACTHLMGLDYHKVRYLTELMNGTFDRTPRFTPVSPETIRVHSNVAAWENLFDAPVSTLLNLEPPPRWKHYLELSAKG